MEYPARLSTKFDFGKHEGRTVEEVCELEPHYISWCLEEVDDFRLDPGAKRYYRECIGNHIDVGN